jgi:putative membrane protein insertion efficiency factor
MGNFLFTLPQRTLMLLVRGYRLFFSAWLGNSCRFEPTCSAYSLQALQRHGAAAGTYLTLRRLARCHPWCAGGHDPVPEHVGFLSKHVAKASFADVTLPTSSSPSLRKKTLP